MAGMAGPGSEISNQILKELNIFRENIGKFNLNNLIP